ncbi:hypothetical protein SDC9_136536 [bioreactor metagenome]|uniref:Uncharacterized protein n=1 Tax=bioreactor metagenome TaxID=1076179 RepID=A0A645DJH9_9ZZZZ
MGKLIFTLRRYTHKFQRLLNARLYRFFGFVFCIMIVQRFFDLLTNRHGRVKRGHGILKDHGYFLAPDLLAHLVFRKFQQILAVQQDFARFNLPYSLRKKAQDRKRRCGFARTGFAYQAKGLALVKRQVDAVYRIHRFHVRFVYNMKIFDLQKIIRIYHGFHSIFHCYTP